MERCVLGLEYLILIINTETSILSKMMIRYNSMSIIILLDSFVEIDVLMLKFYGSTKDLDYPKLLEEKQYWRIYPTWLHHLS